MDRYCLLRRYRFPSSPTKPSSGTKESEAAEMEGAAFRGDAASVASATDWTPIAPPGAEGGEKHTTVEPDEKILNAPPGKATRPDSA
jgi:hypothetical protein